MVRVKVLAALLLSVLALLGALLLVPLSGWSAVIEWPKAYAPHGLQGSLLAGRVEYFGDPQAQLGPLSWRWRADWPLRLDGELALGPDNWQLQVEGWPWQWQAGLEPRAESPLRPLPLWQSHWQGRLELQGGWRSCRQGSGALQSDRFLLLSPLEVPLGQVELKVRCEPDWHVLWQAREVDSHHLDLDLAPRQRQGRLQGRIEAASPMRTLADLLGLTQPGQAALERDFTWQ